MGPTGECFNLELVSINQSFFQNFNMRPVMINHRGEIKVVTSQTRKEFIWRPNNNPLCLISPGKRLIQGKKKFYGPPMFDINRKKCHDQMSLCPKWRQKKTFKYCLLLSEQPASLFPSSGTNTSKWSQYLKPPKQYYDIQINLMWKLDCLMRQKNVQTWNDSCVLWTLSIGQIRL